MKKVIFTILVCGVMIFGITGCGNKSEKEIKKEDLESVNNQIIEYFQTNGVENYKNFAFNYVDEENKVVIVGLINNSEEEQEIFRKNIVDSKLIKFIKGERSENVNNSFKLIFNQKPGNVKKQIVDKNTNKQYDYNLYVWNGDVQIVIDDKTYSLEEALNGNMITIEKIIEKANQDLPDTSSYDEGGSKVYKYDTYTIIKLHTIDGNRDVYIGNEKLSIHDIK